ncbi:MULTISPECIES: Rep family protein [Lactococcus]|uniref:Rep family protein n=1 Tax=Lactobacillales TaxID=186826 RepID=UPI0003BA0944|nr:MULTISPECIES: Rep family protein [Lactococcus]AGY45980.1 AAA family ATPase [Lactococcus lactis subsp. lactis KLDS 4.0325]ARE27094.1 AAA family ATPase [Lactococcus cremoris]MCT0061436.1 AAA family ATPase [Lactococcus lactis subsp. lactis]MCT0137890.1 AAA family ATPase [Lactococcus lactis subsp. lactis]MCT3084753.1 AAA family ATPase [Lactococcus lactis]
MVDKTNLKAIMLVQQLEDKHWELWDDKTAIQAAREGNCRPLLEEVVTRLSSENIKVEEAYGIIHNKDTISVWNTEKMKNIDEPKANHVHFLFKFDKGASLQKLALAMGIESQYLEKLKSGRYGYDNCQAYLVHAKDDSKYQYSANEVTTILGEDYVSLYNRKMKSWIRGRAKKEAQETSLSVDWIIAEVLAGQLTKNQILLTDEYYKVYGQHKRKINEALDTAGERKSYKTVAELEAGKFKKTVIFVKADSGIGKTALSKKLIGLLQMVAIKFNQVWDFCVTASTNAFDEYNGQDILFLDDIRGDSLTVSDWLKLLDPYMISPISARYHNKLGSAKVIIITSTKHPFKFFENAKGIVGEDLGQFIRRIDYLLTIDGSFNLSTPQKLNNSSITHRYKSLEPNTTSHSFSQPNQQSRNAVLDLLIKTVIRNMQWKKQQKGIIEINQHSYLENSTKKYLNSVEQKELQTEHSDSKPDEIIESFPHLGKVEISKVRSNSS